jgi:hypothetical protein
MIYNMLVSYIMSIYPKIYHVKSINIFSFSPVLGYKKITLILVLFFDTPILPVFKTIQYISYY